MSDVTILTNANALPSVPRCATDTNYPAGTDPWSGLATKVAPSAGLVAQGHVPDQSPPAEMENYYKHALTEAAIELQMRQPQVAAGLNNSSDAPIVWLSARKTALRHELHTVEQRVEYTPNLARFVARNMSSPEGGSGYGLRVACTIPIVGTDVVYSFAPGIAGASNAHSIQPTSDTTITMPGTASTLYYDACVAHDGSGVLLAGTGGSIFRIGKFPNVGAPSSVVFAGGWVSTAQVALVSNPTETRLWTTNAAVARYTISTADGGATLSAVLTTTWDGGAPDATAAMMRPTWDSIRGRWIVSTGDVTSYANLQTTSKLWTSTNGVSWTTLHTSPGVLFVAMKEHRGILWAIGLQLTGHKGMEIYASKDGGDTWIRTGRILTLSNWNPAAGLNNLTQDTSIVPMSGAYLLFQTMLSAGTAAFTGGGATGLDFLVLRTSDMYDS